MNRVAGKNRTSHVASIDHSGDATRVTGTMAPGWPLLPLRLFLGVTFVYAGLQKLANRSFLTGSSSASIHAQLNGAVRTSPIHGLVGGLVHVSTAVGIVIAIGEVAVGVGTLLGLWTRIAAAGGIALSLGLFLTVSFHSSPYFTGSDIVFLFAWTPLLLAGAGGAPALDTWFLARVTPAARGGAAVSRREVVSKGAATGVVAGLVILGGGVTALLGRLLGNSESSSNVKALGSGSTTPPTSPAPTSTAGPTSPSTTGAPTRSVPAGTKLGSASRVPVGGSASFTDPHSGDPGLVIQKTSGHFVAFDAVCPHAGCTVFYQQGAGVIACPCHGSEFNAETGAVETGPASSGLGVISVSEGPDGNLYVDI